MKKGLERSRSRSTEGTEAAQSQIEAVLRVLRVGGKVLLRSASVQPWYIELFERMENEETGMKLWSVRCMGRREDGKCIDRVNMYASCWFIVKVGRGTPVGSPIMTASGARKSALKRRRTGSGGSEGSNVSSASGSEVGQMSPGGFRGRNIAKKSLATRDDEDGDDTETDSRSKPESKSKRGLLEDIMLPGAAMDEEDSERF